MKDSGIPEQMHPNQGTFKLGLPQTRAPQPMEGTALPHFPLPSDVWHFFYCLVSCWWVSPVGAGCSCSRWMFPWDAH